MTTEDKMLFQFYNIKGYDFEVSQNKAISATFSSKTDQTTGEGTNVDSGEE